MLQATLLAFSYNVLVGIELVAGSPLPAAEQEDYLALWRYIGWLLGVDGRLDPCRNVPRAKAMLESVIMHLLEPDEHSVAVAQHLLQVIPPIGAEGLNRRPPVGACRLFLGPGFRLAARWNRLGETVKTRKKREKTGQKWARYGLKGVKDGS